MIDADTSTKTRHTVEKVDHVTPIRQRLNIIQGEAKWGRGEYIVFTTILGSCVAACIRDPQLGLGGMNHFLLPGRGVSDEHGQDQRYGEHLMERLVAGLLNAGARLDRLEAKLFGGASTQSVHSDIGAQNAAFATEFLRRKGISYKGGDLGGMRGRRIEYWPQSGQARQIRMRPAALVGLSGQEFADPAWLPTSADGVRPDHGPSRSVWRPVVASATVALPMH